MTDPRFAEPEGFVWASFQNAGGARIRYGRLKSDRPWGRVVILGGFREPAEKYFEAARFFADLGLDVFIMDWRGQGGSSRYLPADPMKAHARDFADHVDTLFRFTRLIGPGKPLFVSAHSMGGHLALKFMAAYPAVFDAAIVCAPMMDIRTWPVPRTLARALARCAVFFGRSASYVPGAGPWKEPGEAFESNPKSHDPARFAVQDEWFARVPALRLGGPTFGWLHAAFLSVASMKAPLVLRRVKAPVLMGIAEADKVVDVQAARRAAGILPRCRVVEVPGAKHEIWMEAEEFRAPWTEAVRAFVTGIEKEKQG